jgi:hypothetical protein
VLTGFYLNGGGAASVQEIIPQGANVLDVTLEARQLSPRGGGMSCQLRDGRAWLVGQAWRVGCGELEVFE